MLMYLYLNVIQIVLHMPLLKIKFINFREISKNTSIKIGTPIFFYGKDLLNKIRIIRCNKNILF